MAAYKNILVAIDLSDESAKIINRAAEVADGDASRLSLIHVVEPVAAAYPIDAYAINMTRLQEEAVEMASTRLSEIAGRHGVAASRSFPVVGPAAAEIRQKAEDLGSDLIVIGSHGTSGWKLLLGSTANKVLHGASCDILTVRVGG